MNEPQRSALLAGRGILAVALLAVGLWPPWSALEAQRAREAWATAARAAIGRPAVTPLGIPLLLGVVAVMVLRPLLVLVLPSAAVFAWGSLTKGGHRA